MVRPLVPCNGCFLKGASWPVINRSLITELCRASRMGRPPLFPLSPLLLLCSTVSSAAICPWLLSLLFLCPELSWNRNGWTSCLFCNSKVIRPIVVDKFSHFILLIHFSSQKFTKVFVHHFLLSHLIPCVLWLQNTGLKVLFCVWLCLLLCDRGVECPADCGISPAAELQLDWLWKAVVDANPQLCCLQTTFLALIYSQERDVTMANPQLQLWTICPGPDVVVLGVLLIIVFLGRLLDFQVISTPSFVEGIFFHEFFIAIDGWCP